MPKTEVVLFQEDDGTVPLLQWFDQLPSKAQDKCIVRIERLAEMGYELHRPEADYLRDGIHELRVPLQRIQYRMLYFFYKEKAVISNGLRKDSGVPSKEIDAAINRMSRFGEDPVKHT